MIFNLFKPKKVYILHSVPIEHKSESKLFMDRYAKVEDVFSTEKKAQHDCDLYNNNCQYKYYYIETYCLR